MTTSTTSSTASSRVCTTASIDWRTNTVGSYTIVYAMPCGKSLESCAMVARTSWDSCRAFDPGAWKTGIATASWLSR